MRAGENRDRDGEPAEALDEADAEALVQRRRRPRAGRAGSPAWSSCEPWPPASRSVASRCWDMSGLKPVPRIPKWPSTKNGSEAATRAASATGKPARSASSPPSMPSPQIGDRGDREAEHDDRRGRAAPGQPHRSPADCAEQRLDPTAGVSHDQRRAPQSPIAACPIASDVPDTANTAA